MSKDLGKSTSYAYYVEEGGTKTPQEYGEMLVNIDTVATRAEEAADSAAESATGALNSKNAAQTAATTATNKASEATTAATTATNKAAEAQADADAAALDASQALSAASTATTKATEATTAAATATSAATTATTAKDDAVSAKTAAQTAQTGAETAAASVSASAAQIATNAADISQLKSEITDKSDTADMLKAFPTDTASGSVASFADGANVPVKSLIVNIDPVQSGSGDPSPTNVRPISGWSEVNVQRTGKNLWGGEKLADDIVAKVQGATKNTTNKTVTYSSAWVSAKVLFANFKENTQYTFYMSTESSSTNLRVWYSDETNATILPNTIFVSQSGKTVDRLAGLYASGNTALKYEECGIFEGVITVQNFGPYSGQSISIQLGQTVYGGTLDVLSGVLTVDKAIGDMGDMTWRYGSNYGGYFVSTSIKDLVANTYVCMSSMYKNIPLNSSAITNNNYVIDINANGSGSAITGAEAKGSIIAVNRDYTTAADFKAAMSGVQLVYELATPTTVTLTPNELSTLLGANNIWSDAGDTAVEYRADPTLYIQRLTEPDADMVADANIVSGQYFMVGNTLYKATANIASGATISPNVNCTRKSLSEALNELNA